VNSHFISGLPRSGSTLLAALLRQNPGFYSAMTSPIGGASRSHAGNRERRQWVFRVHFPWTKTGTAYYHPPTEREVISDTNRRWCSKLPLIRELFPEAKVICCIRNIAWIMDSIELLIRRNAFDVSRLFNNPAEEVNNFTARLIWAIGLINSSVFIVRT